MDILFGMNSEEGILLTQFLKVFAKVLNYDQLIIWTVIKIFSFIVTNCIWNWPHPGHPCHLSPVGGWVGDLWTIYTFRKVKDHRTPWCPFLHFSWSYPRTGIPLISLIWTVHWLKRFLSITWEEGKTMVIDYHAGESVALFFILRTRQCTTVRNSESQGMITQFLNLCLCVCHC